MCYFINPQTNDDRGERLETESDLIYNNTFDDESEDDCDDMEYTAMLERIVYPVCVYTKQLQDDRLDLLQQLQKRTVPCVCHEKTTTPEQKTSHENFTQTELNSFSTTCIMSYIQTPTVRINQYEDSTKQEEDEKIKDHAHSYQRKEQEIEILTNRLNNASKKAEGLQSKNEELEELLNKTTNCCKRCSTQLSVSGSIVKTGRGKLQESNEKCVPLSNGDTTLVQQLLDEQEKLQKELDNVQTRLKDEVQKTEETQLKLEATNKQRDTILKSNQAPEAQASSMREKIDKLQEGYRVDQGTLVQQLLTEQEKNTEKMKAIQRELSCANTRIGNAESEKITFMNKITELQRTCHSLQQAVISKDSLNKNLREQCRNTQDELDNVKNRLSKLMGQKLTDNNPNIADLSDKNRPTKLAERYSELYDNQWTDAFETLDQGNEANTIGLLREILMDTYRYCKANAQKQMITMKSAIIPGDNKVIPAEIVKQLKDCRKVVAEETGRQMLEEYLHTLHSSEKWFTVAALRVEDYVRECFAICWLMSVQDPPVVLSNEEKNGDRFNTDLFKAYTVTGKSVAYIVWPAMMLHENGPLLCKGVAQGFNA